MFQRVWWEYVQTAPLFCHWNSSVEDQGTGPFCLFPRLSASCELGKKPTLGILSCKWALPVFLFMSWISLSSPSTNSTVFDRIAVGNWKSGPTELETGDFSLSCFYSKSSTLGLSFSCLQRHPPTLASSLGGICCHTHTKLSLGLIWISKGPLFFPFLRMTNGCYITECQNLESSVYQKVIMI